MFDQAAMLDRSAAAVAAELRREEAMEVEPDVVELPAVFSGIIRIKRTALLAALGIPGGPANLYRSRPFATAVAAQQLQPVSGEPPQPAADELQPGVAEENKNEQLQIGAVMMASPFAPAATRPRYNGPAPQGYVPDIQHAPGQAITHEQV